MTTGHFGLATGVTAFSRRVPLWALMIASYLMDIVFIVLVAVGLESFAPMNPAHPAYGQVIIHAYYSHSLAGAIVLAAAAALVGGAIWGKRNGLVLGAVVLSHWVLDLVVHRPDLPILPGNAGNLPLLGFGLWNLPAVSAAVELAIVITGVYLYYRSSRAAAAVSGGPERKQRTRALLAVMVTAVLLVLLLVSDLLALPTGVGLLIMVLLVVLCGWLDSRIVRKELAREGDRRFAS